MFKSFVSTGVSTGLFIMAGLLFSALASASFADVITPSSVGVGKDPVLPEPYATKPVQHKSTVIGWPEGKMPQAPAGFKVTLFAGHLDNPRWLYVLPNGDVLVAEAKTGSSPGRIILLRAAPGAGAAETQSVFLKDLNQPFGMALVKDTLYVGQTDAVLGFPYKTGETEISAAGEKILDLPAGGYNNHWTRNILASPDGAKLYVTVGSGSNVGEHGIANETRRANILQINPDGSNERVFASGLRNPVGLGWEPRTGKLWTAVNERDNLGDDLVPDYMTSVTQGGFYGWPYVYYGRHPDPRWTSIPPGTAEKTLVPDYGLGSHTASLGLAFYTGKVFPRHYDGGVFIGQHGSWNRSVFAGYRVVFIPFSHGRPAGAPEDFLTGFMKDTGASEAYGRPVGVAVAKDGALLVADDAGGAIWRVSPN